MWWPQGWGLYCLSEQYDVSACDSNLVKVFAQRRSLFFLLLNMLVVHMSVKLVVLSVLCGHTLHLWFIIIVVLTRLVVHKRTITCLMQTII